MFCVIWKYQIPEFGIGQLGSEIHANGVGYDDYLASLEK